MLDCERSVTRTLFMDENSDRNHYNLIFETGSV